MAKRFIDTTIWTQNEWFRKLDTKTKLFWFYLFTNCDNVGVWEEDFELVSFILNEEINEGIYSNLKERIYKISPKKIWIKDFCDFQYGELVESNTGNKPHQSYIKSLKSYGLWEIYLDPNNAIDREIFRDS